MVHAKKRSNSTAHARYSLQLIICRVYMCWLYFPKEYCQYTDYVINYILCNLGFHFYHENEITQSISKLIYMFQH